MSRSCVELLLLVVHGSSSSSSSNLRLLRSRPTYLEGGGLALARALRALGGKNVLIFKVKNLYAKM